MNVYSYCDISIESEIVLAGLGVSPDGNPDVCFRVDRSNHPPTIDGAWQRSALDETNGISDAVLSGTDVHCLIFKNIGTFEIRNGFSEICCHPEPAITLNSIQHLLLDQVLPRVLSARGKLMVHGSCIEHPRGVIVFAGGTGAGKSTLAAGFSQHGFPILSDDGLQLREAAARVTVIPTYPSLRLWEDSIAGLSIGAASAEPMAHYSSKKRISSGAASAEPMAHYSSKKRISSEQVAHPVERRALCLFFIRPQPPGEPPSMHRIVKREAFFELSKQVFILDHSSHEQALARMKLIADLVRRLPMYSFSIPHDYSVLNQLRMEVLELVETL